MQEHIERYYNGNDDRKYLCTNAYEKVTNAEFWEVCPNCGLIPKVWEFDNGRKTACGCGKNKYSHFSIRAESILSVMKNSENGQSMADYDEDDLRRNWNHWARTGEILWECKDNRW